MNPHNQRQRTTQQTPEALAGLEPMHVTRAKGHTSGDTVGHHIEVTPDLYQSTHVTAEVLVTQRGDTYIPEEGERVFATRRTNGQPVVVGSRYGQEDDIPEFEPGERRIGHSPTESHIRLKPDGTVRVEGDGGGVYKAFPDGTVAMTDDAGHGIECQNNGEIHLYGQVKQHTSDTLDL